LTSNVSMRHDQLSLLDNPAWNALSTTHSSFAEGNEDAKRYQVDVAPLAATRDQSPESYRSLAKLLGPGGQTVLSLVTLPEFPPGWKIVRSAPNLQMVWNDSAPPQVKHSFEDLNTSHIDEMLALTELNNLRRFRRRSPELGSYIGMRESGRLVAMAGEGFRFLGYTEISAVCTHPDYRGHGYASSLVSALVRKITGQGQIPFLHVRRDNADAIRVYEKLGFRTRRDITFMIVKRE
jgi:ribosomal protein S18 acetylase RimI-like enzyme